MTGRIGMIGSYKGGSGKTVIAVNLSAALSIKKKKILLIDADPQSDSTRALLGNSTVIEKSMYHLFESFAKDDDLDIGDCIYPTIHKNLFILPNITETSVQEIPLSKGFPATAHILRDKIRDYAVKNFDYTFIDCPPTVSIFVVNAMHAADFIIIPVDAGSGNSLEGAKSILTMMKDIQDLKFLRIVINRSDKRKTTHKANIQNAHNKFGEDKVFNSMIMESDFFKRIERLTATTIFSDRRAQSSRGQAEFRKLSIEFMDTIDRVYE